MLFGSYHTPKRIQGARCALHACNARPTSIDLFLVIRALPVSPISFGIVTCKFVAFRRATCRMGRSDPLVKVNEALWPGRPTHPFDSTPQTRGEGSAVVSACGTRATTADRLWRAAARRSGLAEPIVVGAQFKARQSTSPMLRGWGGWLHAARKFGPSIRIHVDGMRRLAPHGTRRLNQRGSGRSLPRENSGSARWHLELCYRCDVKSVLSKQ
jgi:hypothetical protein